MLGALNMTVVAVFGQLDELPLLISSTHPFVFLSYNSPSPPSPPPPPPPSPPPPPPSSSPPPPRDKTV